MGFLAISLREMKKSSLFLCKSNGIKKIAVLFLQLSYQHDSLQLFLLKGGHFYVRT